MSKDIRSDKELIEAVEAIFDIKVSNIIKNENEYIFVYRGNNFRGNCTK